MCFKHALSSAAAFDASSSASVLIAGVISRDESIDERWTSA